MVLDWSKKRSLFSRWRHSPLTDKDSINNAAGSQKDQFRDSLEPFNFERSNAARDAARREAAWIPAKTYFLPEWSL